MNCYAKMLTCRHNKLEQASPLDPEKPLTWVQYKNKKNLLLWQEKFREWKLMESWT